MNRIAFASLAVALSAAAPAHAVTNENGDILITQAAVNAGSITPGDTAGFPVTISLPGTYRLATNLTVTTAVNGFEVRANDVTIEMGGHTLAGSEVGRNGLASFNRNLRVEHGTVRGFTNDGVRSIEQFLTVTDMVITSNYRFGVYADSTGKQLLGVAYANIAASRVSYNYQGGIKCGSMCRVESSIISSNGVGGIEFDGPAGLALGNVVSENGRFGISFLEAGGAGNNTVMNNYLNAPASNQITGSYVPMQPNACSPVCPPPP